MSNPTAFRELIELWPSREGMASDIGVAAWVVQKWWERRTIPAKWWAAVLATERAGHAGVTAQMMTDWASRVPVAETRGEPAEART